MLVENQVVQLLQDFIPYMTKKFKLLCKKLLIFHDISFGYTYLNLLNYYFLFNY